MFLTTRRALTCTFLCLPPFQLLDAAAVFWSIRQSGSNSHDVFARIVGNDTDGLAGFKLRFKPRPDVELDLANATWTSSFSTLDASFIAKEISIESHIEARGLGLNESIKVGELTIPGSTVDTEFGQRSNLYSSSFDTTETYVFGLQPETEVIRDQRYVSPTFRGGAIHGDPIIDFFPWSIDFGEVEVGSTLILNDIFYMAPSFGGPFEIQNVRVDGKAAENFGVPELPSSVTFSDAPQTYDFAFAPDRTGEFTASFDVESLSEGFGFFPFSISLHGVGIPPPSDCDQDGVVTILDANCTQNAVLHEFLSNHGTLPGDVDGMGGVDFADFLVLAGNFGRSTAAYTDGDFDTDGEVGFADFLLLSSNFGKGSDFVSGVAAVPESSSLSLLLATVGFMFALRHGFSSRCGGPRSRDIS